MAKCTFCGTNINPGTGKMFVKVDGRILYFCSMKCEKQTFKLNHKSRTTKWTDEAQKVKKGAKK